MAGETAKTPVEQAPEEENYQNWVNLTLGGQMLGGDHAQFKQANHTGSDVFGGIDDMHYEKSLGKRTQLIIDGHAIFDNNDYKVKVELNQTDVGYIHAGYTQFRTWYDGSGGYLPTNRQFFAPFGENALALDRGDAWVELGLRMANLPELTVRYDHTFRDGEKDSTDWGYNTSTTNTPLRRLNAPSYYNIHEQSDVLTANATQTFFGNTEMTLGMRYEFDRNNNTLNELTQPAGPAVSYTLYNNNQESTDLLNGHFSSVSRFNDKCWLSLGYGYTSMSSDIGGSRYNNNVPPTVTYTNLVGSVESSQQVINFNLMCVPLKDLTIVPSLRIGVGSTEGLSTSSAAAASGYASDRTNEIEQALDIRYSGIDNILIYARGDWDERNERAQSYGSNYGATGNLNSNPDYLSQKYAIGANWYPLTHLNFSLEYYYKIENTDFNWVGNQTGIINKLNSNTNDVNARITWKPIGALSLVTRYDMQYNTIENAGINNPAPPAVTTYVGEQQSATITNNIFSECVTWTPLARLYVEAAASVVLSETKSPVSSIIATNAYIAAGNTNPSVLNFGNNYWTASTLVGFVIDDKTDLQLGYTYYHAADYQNNASAGMPYGAGAVENTVTAGIVRKLTKNISLSLNYSYYVYTDQTSGNHNNYTANVISSGLQFKF